MMAGLDDLGVEREPHLAVARRELNLLDVEAELVQTPQPRLELAAFPDVEHLVARELVPELVVA